ncbi:MAG: glycosyltransferase, partial [Sphingobacteriales bacterium]
MKEHKYTVVVPTRERADTLLHTLRTCVTQNYDNLTILVSDNCSQDTTEEVVRSFNDPRIQYVNTGKRLSMSHNWEFALSQVR